MLDRTDRRRFLTQTAACGGLLGLGDFSFLAQLPAVSAEEAKLDPKLVRVQPEIEPLVRLLEETPRDRLIEEVAGKIEHGTSYREVLAALLLAGVRNIQPRPSVGFKFHSVLVVNSAHLASLSSPPSDRWLPIFWALDYFKAKQIEEQRRSGWQMTAVDEGRLPAPHKAREQFIDAMENWDDEVADAAVASLARNAGAGEVYELFYRFGMRDFRSIGHKAIFVANSQRTLGCVGWQNAEPVLRSLAFALLNHRGEPNPADSDLEADRPWRRNQELVTQIRADWLDGKADESATRQLIATLHDGSSDDACDQAVDMLNRGVSPQSLWDAVLVGAGELLMRQPGIIGLHGLTTSNSLYYAFIDSGDDRTRRLLLLQNCAFVPMFREAAKRRGKVRSLSVDDVAPAPLEHSSQTGALEEIFSDISRDRLAAAAKVRSYAKTTQNAKRFIDAARRLVFLKGNDAHDYKYSSAVLEDYYHVSPTWRDRFLALSVFNLIGSGERDNDLVQRIRGALA